MTTVPPDLAVRLLRAKAAALEAIVLTSATANGGDVTDEHLITADVALLASLLADEIERRS